jgi:hypothetical protein
MSFNAEHFQLRERCPVCSAADNPDIYRCALTADPVRSFIATHYAPQGQVDWSLFQGTDYVLAECGGCGLIYQRAVPNAALLDALYNRMISPAFLEGVERERLTIDNFNQIAGETAVLLRMAGKPPSEVRWLDYGFGHGRWARVARAMGTQVYATEIGEEKKAAAAALGVRIVSDAEVDAMRFDVVHTEQVLEHLAEPGRDFARLAAVTAGILKVAVPRHRNLHALLAAKGMTPRSPIGRALRGEALSQEDDTYVAVQPLEHLNTFCARTMERLAADNRMRIVSRVRRAAVPIDLSDARRLRGSLVQLGKMAAKMIIRPDGGYYLFRPL